MSDKSERERLQKLRDSQITARHPGISKIRNYDWEAHARRGRVINKKLKARQKPLPLDLYDLLPRRWKGAIIGSGIGLLVLIAAAFLLSDIGVFLGLVGLVICGVVGFVLGAVLQEESPMP
jgi:hypothetical protein